MKAFQVAKLFNGALYRFAVRRLADFYRSAVGSRLQGFRPKLLQRHPFRSKTHYLGVGRLPFFAAGFEQFNDLFVFQETQIDKLSGHEFFHILIILGAFVRVHFQ